MSGPTLFGLRVEKRVDGTGRINFRRESYFLVVHLCKIPSKTTHIVKEK